ncbi:MAG: autotransporter-associated beta strand repeat-containing protein [Kiritimatiellae bacterium]|nr:autotransporter-associated beta strand repeat-containing protein [Kiritimatiellia bacterium]
MRAWLIGLSGVALIGLAEPITWTGPDGGSFSDEANWNLGRVPGEGDQITIQGANKAVFDADGAEYPFDRLSVVGSFDIANGLLRGVGVNSVGNGASPGVITQTGGTLELSGWGDDPIRLSGPLNDPSQYFLSGGVLNGFNDGNFQIGYHGAGELTQTGGRLHCGAFLVLGRYPGDVGTYTMSGGILEMERTNRFLLIGEEGSGRLTLTGTAQANLIGLRIGNGSAELSGSALLQTTFIDHDARYNGVSTLTIDGGTIATRGTGLINDAFFNGPITTVVKEHGVTFDVTEGSDVTVSVPLSGSPTDGGLVKKGTGVLSLTGANTLTGPTVVNEGLLVVNDPAAVATSSGIGVAAGAGVGIWMTAINPQTVAALLGSISFSQGTYLALDTTPGSANLGDTIPFPAGVSLAKTGKNRLSITTPQSYTGETRIYRGILHAGCEGAIPATSCLSLLGGSYAPGTASYAAIFGTGASELKVNAGYPLGLAACGNDLTVTLGNDGAAERIIGDAAFDVPTFLLNDTGADHPLTLTNPLALEKPLTVTVNSDQPVTLSGLITSTDSTDVEYAQSLAKTGTGTLKLPAGVSFANKRNALLVDGGTVELGGSLTGLLVALRAGGRLTVDDPALVGDLHHLLIGTLTGTGTMEMSAGTIDATWQFAIGDSDGTSGRLDISGGTITCERLGVGRFGNGEVNQTGGTIYRNRGGDEAYLAGLDNNHKNATATYNLTGDGELKVAGNFQIGRYGKGTLNQSAGLVECNTWMALGRFIDSVGTYNMTGGRLFVSGGGQGLVIGEEGTAVLNASGDSVIEIAGTLYFSGGSGWTGTGNGSLYLRDGATLITKQIYRNDTSSPMAFTVNGGIIRVPDANATYSDFLHGIKNLSVGPKGLTLDTGNNTVVINQSLSDSHSSGQIVKRGEGTLVIGAANNLSGGLSVEEGEVVLGPSYKGAYAAVTEQSDDLLHRWSFNGSLADSVGGANAEYIGSTSVAYNQEGNAVSLPGGANGTGAINLGHDLFPTDGTPVTLEIWATQREIKNWSRVFDFGNGQDNYILLSWTQGTDINLDDAEVKFNGLAWQNLNKMAPFTLGQEFHISAVFIPNVFGDGRMMVRWAKRETNGRLVRSSVTITPAAYSFADLQQNSFFLGRSRYGGDNDAAADYNEVRFWKIALSDEQLTQSVLLGPDALPDFSTSDANILPEEPDAALVNANYLLHRWSFNGDATDSVGGQDATLNGACTYTDGKQVRLAGGNKGTSWVDLGPYILPTTATPTTIEIWGTQHTVKNWARILDIANPADHTNDAILFCWSQGTDINKDGVCIKAVHKNNLTLSGLAPFTLEQEFHICYVFIPDETGLNTTVTCYKQDAKTGDTLAKFSFVAENWTLAYQSQQECFLGRSQYPDNDPNASYNEVRIWNAGLTESQLSRNAVAGPDRVLPIADDGSSSSLSPLTLAEKAVFNTAAQDVTIGTINGIGTVTGSGTVTVTEALDPAGDEVGSLTVDAPLAITGEWLIDIADGTADCVTGEGTIDISACTLNVRSLDQLKGGTFLIATLPPNAITGAFKADNLQGSGFCVKYAPSEGTLKLIPNGMVIFIN